MIVFDLRCAVGHVFEAWFASSAGYVEQQTAGQVSCPICGNDEIEKAVTAPAIPAKGNRGTPAPAAVKQALAALAQQQATALETSEWVGSDFASRARAMHDGDQPGGPIHGQASIADARALVADGVPIAPLPFPVTPPKSQH